MSATNYDGVGDADFVADRLAEIQTANVADTLTAQEAEETRDYVQRAADPDTVFVDVGDDRIPCDPIGLGKRTRISRELMAAEEDGDDMAVLDAVLDMIDALDELSADRYNQAYWDDLQAEDIRDAFRELSQKSAGGDRAGK